MYGTFLNDAFKVIGVFGHFPLFYDSEVLEIHMYRNAFPGEEYPTTRIEFTIHGWETTLELLTPTKHKREKHHHVKFRFDHVDQVELHGFNHQNILSELLIKEIVEDHARLRVEFYDSHGLEGSFRAVSGAILEVIPCDENGMLFQ